MPSLQPGQRAFEAFEGLDGVAAEEVINVGESSGHAAGERLVAVVALERVEPDYPVGAALEHCHFPREPLRVAALPAIADDEHYGAGREQPRAVAHVELADALADAR